MKSETGRVSSPYQKEWIGCPAKPPERASLFCSLPDGHGPEHVCLSITDDVLLAWYEDVSMMTAPARLPSPPD